MVKRLLKYWSSEIVGLHEAAYLLALFAFLSQLLALVRDRLLASYIGPSTTLDIYYTAFRIPDLIFITIGSLVSVSVLIPFLTAKYREGYQAEKRFVDNIFSFFFLLVVAVSLIVWCLVPTLVTALFPGFTGVEMTEVIHMTRILLLSPILLGISNFFASITQVTKRFVIYAVSPLVYNLGIIFGIVCLYPVYGLTGLISGVILGAMGHLLIQVPFVVKKKLLPTLIGRFDWAGIWAVARLSLPRTITLGVFQIALIVLLGFASLMEEGSIAIFNLAFNLQSVPLAIIGVSYSVAAFPTLAKLFADGERSKFVAEVATSARQIIFWSLPVMALFIVLRAQIVRVILGAGAFDWNHTRLTAAALALFSVSLIGQCLVALLIRAFYAQGDTKRPLVISLSAGILVIVLAKLGLHIFTTYPLAQTSLESLLRVEGIAGTALLVLPLGYSLAILFQLVALWLTFVRSHQGTGRLITRTLWHSGIASLAIGVVTYAGLNLFDAYFDLDSLVGVLLQGLLAGLLGILAGLIVLKLFSSPELSVVWRTLRAKIWRAKPLPADTDPLVS